MKKLILLFIPAALIAIAMRKPRAVIEFEEDGWKCKSSPNIAVKESGRKFIIKSKRDGYGIVKFSNGMKVAEYRFKMLGGRFMNVNSRGKTIELPVMVV